MAPSKVSIKIKNDHSSLKHQGKNETQANLETLNEQESDAHISPSPKHEQKSSDLGATNRIGVSFDKAKEYGMIDEILTRGE